MTCFKNSGIIKYKIKTARVPKGRFKMTKQFDNSNTVSIWKKVAKSGKEYYSGIVYVGNVAHTITLFDNEVTSEAQPILRGKIELKETK